MLARPRHFRKHAATHAALVLIQACCGLSAQNFTARSAGLNPFGVNGPLPFGRALESATGAGLKGGFSYGVGVNAVYDSNFFLTEDDEESEVTLSLSPSIDYTSDPEGGAPMVITAGYSPSANAYLNNSELNSVDQSGSVAMTISGSRTTISAYAGYSQDSGTDRLAGGFFTGTSISVGAQANYQLAPRTTVFASWSSAITDYGNGEDGVSAGGGGGGTDSAVGFDGHSFGAGGFWAATERFSIGPSFNYSTTTSDNIGTRDSWGASVQASYKATEKIGLGASFGVETSDYSREEDGGSNYNFTGSLNTSYQINALWSCGASIQSGVVPSPTQANYVINNWSVSSSLSRALLIGSAGLGVDAQFSSYDAVGPTGVSQVDENSYGISISYSRPLFNERVGFGTSLRYSFNEGDIEYTQLQLTAGLSMQF